MVDEGAIGGEGDGGGIGEEKYHCEENYQDVGGEE